MDVGPDRPGVLLDAVRVRPVGWGSVTHSRARRAARATARSPPPTTPVGVHVDTQKPRAGVKARVPGMGWSLKAVEHGTPLRHETGLQAPRPQTWSRPRS
ncbi:hypothetical protein GCM10023324_25930 [Streptomyces youssoufiensis]